MDDTLDRLAGAKLFSTLDLASGYWQVEVVEKDQPITLFATPEGLYQFQVMPFGLCNAPATFQWLIDRVLGSLIWSSCLLYPDGIIVVGTSRKEHLGKLRQAGLKLKPMNCKLCQKSVTYLRQVVFAEGVAADPSKAAVAGWPIPLSKHKVQQNLRLTNNYWKFITNLAAIAKLLHRFTEKKRCF